MDKANEERVTQITKKSKNFTKWYTDVVLKAELADYSPVRGCMVIRPYGFAIWENIQKAMDLMIKEAGVENAYFPIFIPESFLKKEKEHVEGFAPQLAVVTHGGGKKLAEPLVVRPTSETVMYAMFAKWIKSWRDLPLLINQWCNIVRWELRTYLFLRTMEFLWQEGHTAHATEKEAEKETLRALAMYRQLAENYLGIATVAGRKSDSEKFPGAKNTFTIEALMPDGKALQLGTSHELGQNFAKPFQIQFQDKEGKLRYVWQTCWGFSTRSIGGLIMAHGNDQGLVLPPKITPIQIVIVPIMNKNKQKVCDFALKIRKLLKDYRVKIDFREEYTPGWKFNEWELKGVPIRIEIGNKEIEGNYLTVVRRDKNEKLKIILRQAQDNAEQSRSIKNEGLQLEIKNLLAEIQADLYQKSKEFLDENTYEINDYTEFKEIMKAKRGFIKSYWCENPKCEEKIKTETKATTRCLLLDAKKEKGKCVYCGKPAIHHWLFAQAY